MYSGFGSDVKNTDLGGQILPAVLPNHYDSIENCIHYSGKT